jgi:hypothetical protein
MITRITLGLGVVIAAAITLAPAAPAHATGGSHCVSAWEFRKVHNGMTRGKVHRIFDTKGWNLFDNGPNYVYNSAREYRHCNGGIVQIQYNNFRPLWQGGPQRVVYKQTY